MDPLLTARAGMMNAERRFAASATRVAQMGCDGNVDLVHEVVEQIQAKTQFSANAQVVRFSDEMWQALLDIQDEKPTR
jgi:flagellar basal body rod protein FlgG